MFARLFSGFALLLFVGAFLGALHSPAQAQIPLPGMSPAAPAAPAEVALPDPLTPEAVREMVARMSDDQVRAMLLDRLDAVAEAEQAPRITCRWRQG